MNDTPKTPETEPEHRDDPMKVVVKRMFRVYSTILELAWEVARSRSAALLTAMIVLGIWGAAGAFLTKLVLNALAQGDARQAWKWAGLYLLQFVGTAMLNHLLGFLQFDMGDRISQAVDQKLMEISMGSAGLDHLERPEFADKIKLVRNHQYVPFSALANVNTLAYLFFGMASAIVLLGSIHPALMLMPVIAAPVGYLQFWSLRRHFKRWDEVAPEDRLAQHYLELATEPKAAKEVRLFGLGPMFVDRQREITHGYIRKIFRDRLKRSTVGMATGALYGATLAGAIGFIGYLALNRRADIGQVGMGVMVARMVIGQVEMAANLVSWLAELSFVGERYLWLMDYKPDVQVAVGDDIKPVPEGIRHGITFEGVTFTYPGTDVEVLHGIDLFIPAGKTIALVGENGAGKSSLVKLLSRFYDPSGGRITVDGVDLREIDLEDWRRRVGATYQDFVRFQLIASEAIGVGDLEHIVDMDRITVAATRSGANRSIDRLPNGLQTQLGREFTDGTDLSEGEWQRVALARGSMREGPVLLMLDEPTASLDARSENEVFERYAELSQPTADRPAPISVFVSHRFSTVRMADLIAVVHEGRITEIGTHDELLATPGRYAELFNLQASRYD